MQNAELKLVDVINWNLVFRFDKTVYYGLKSKLREEVNKIT